MFGTDPLQSAEEAGLRYVSNGGACIRRIRCGNGFRYSGPDGKPLRDPKHLARIRSLVIPPAWENVWICPSANGHLQAYGWDARGRKQYRYHPQYRAIRDEAKFSRMIAFGTVLALIRKAVERDLHRPGLPKQKVLATVIRLLETTFIRVGNDEYAEENGSYGLTTLRNKHVRIDGATLTFRFRGKSGQEASIELTDARLARIVRRCQELPGYQLFEYIDREGQTCRVDSADVNRYIRELSGHDFTAKDFRTWAGSVLAARELSGVGPVHTASAGKRAVVTAVKNVARRLGNRPATCRKYYIHPAVLDAYSEGTLEEMMKRGEQQSAAYEGRGLRPDEYCVMVAIAEYQTKHASAPRKAA
jgi:DNA topoisomerase-1